MKWLSLIAAGIGLSYGQTAMDWPNLARYRAANAEVRQPAEGENRVVFMGDSITDFCTPQFATYFPPSPISVEGSAAKPRPKC